MRETEKISWLFKMALEFRRNPFLFLIEHPEAPNILQELIAREMLTEDEITIANVAGRGEKEERNENQTSRR